MHDFIRLCFAPFNLPITVMLGTAIGYWLMFLMGAVTLDLFDADIDIDADIDLDPSIDLEVDMNVDADVDVGVDADVTTDLDAVAEGGDAVGEQSEVGGHSGHWFMSFLRFFNVGDVPIVVLYSGFACSLWALTILTSHYFNPSLLWWRSVAMFVPNVVASLFLTKITTAPFRSLFRHANLGMAKPLRLVGRTCIITTSSVSPRFGQARFDPPDGSAPVMLNVRTRDDTAILSKGQEAVILDHDVEKSTFLVVPFNLGE